SPHLERYAFNGNDLYFGAGFTRRIFGPSKLRAPFFGADLDDAAIRGGDAFGDDAGPADHGVNVGGLVADLQAGLEPVAEDGEIDERKNAGAEDADIAGVSEKADDAADGQRSANEGQVEAGENAQSKLRYNAHETDDNEHPVDPVAHGDLLPGC